MKVYELKGHALDWAVAYIMGHRVAENYGSYIRIYLPDPKQSGYTLAFCPSTDWALGGPIIERERILIQPEISKEGAGNAWSAIAISGVEQYGPTPLIAAMRCYVAAKWNHEVEIPEELKCQD